MNILIKNAIQRRATITFVYDGEVRYAEPHCYGVSTAGNEVLRAFQTQGTSRSATVPDWKMFSVKRIESLRILPHGFPQNRPGYDPNDDGMVRVFVHV